MEQDSEAAQAAAVADLPSEHVPAVVQVDWVVFTVGLSEQLPAVVQTVWVVFTVGLSEQLPVEAQAA